MKYIILLILAVLFSCTRSDDAYVNLKTNLREDVNCNINYESYNIPIDSITYSHYGIFSSFNFSNNDFIAGYNRKMNSIDVFNLTNRTFFKHLFLRKAGPNQLADVFGLYVLNWDSIFVYSNGNVCIIDSSGSIKYKKDLSKLPIKETGLKRTLSSTYQTNMFYSKERNSVFLIHTPRNVKFFSETFYSIPFLAEFNLTRNTLELVSVHYSNFFTKNNYVGYTYSPYVRIVKDKIIYCFAGESNIYSFDLNTKVLETFGGRSNFTKNTTTVMPFTNSLTQNLHHESESVIFQNVIFDPYRNLFYRFHYGDQERQVSANEYNTFLDKKLYLMIFDNEFKLIKEIKLEDYTYTSEFYGVIREGLLLNANHELKRDYNENIAQFVLLKIKIFDENK